MTSNFPIAKDQKLLLIYRLEPDCLGFVGYKNVNKFCAHVTKNILPVDSTFIKWTVLPRLGAEEMEMEYRLSGKLLTPSQVIRYLAVFNREIDEFERAINQAIIGHIDHYFNN